MNYKGLTSSDVLESRKKHGSNALSETERESFIRKFLNNLNDPIIRILLIALFINLIIYIIGLLGIINEATQWYDSLGIAIAVFIAAFVSSYSEYRNDEAFQKLKEEASKIKCKVIRNYICEELSIDELVVDDLILLQTGDKVPADGILIEGTLNVDQSVLNGETEECFKKAEQNSQNLIESSDNSANTFCSYKTFRGSVVCSGEAIVKITAVGVNSEYGKIAKSLQETSDRQTPLNVKLCKLGQQISVFGYLGATAIAIASITNTMIHSPLEPMDFICSMSFVTAILNAFIYAVTIIVMAVPEGLPLMIALVSSLNMGKMLKDNVLVREQSGIETAGSLNILFTDKTGTITKGKLEATAFISGDTTEYKNIDSVPKKLNTILSLSILKNTQCIINQNGNELSVIGSNATDKCLVEFVKTKKDSQLLLNVVDSIPFSSQLKFSASTVMGDLNLTFIKGAPEIIIPKCTKFYNKDCNLQDRYYIDKSSSNEKTSRTIPKQTDCLQGLLNRINELTNNSYRIIALATSNSTIGKDLTTAEQNWCLIGIVCIRDDVRPEAIKAITEVKNAGIHTVMITGDKLETAKAIATESGLIDSENDIVLTSTELNQLNDSELKFKLPNLKVVARALPSDKSRLVRIAQELDLVVGMTGDGVNDSPAIKKADVGFSMGGGTEVAKEASEIVILDDNFLSIEKAILYGRTIYNNIRKFIAFQLTVNLAAVLISFIMQLLGREMPLNIVQILWINLVMDTLAAIALGGEPPLASYMQEKPKNRSENIISKYMLSSFSFNAIWICALGFILLLAPGIDVLLTNGDLATSSPEFKKIQLTTFFTFFMFSIIFNMFNTRSQGFNLFEKITENKPFIFVIFTIIAIQIIMTQSGLLFPIFGKIMSCYGLDIRQWIIAIIMALTIIPADFLRKLLLNLLKLGHNK